MTSLEDAPISPELLGYFDAASRDEAHQKVLEAFIELSQSRGITRAFLARRIGKSPEQITRMLAAPGNWTLETYTRLALAMGFKPKHELERIADLTRSNFHHPAVHRAEMVKQASPAHNAGGDRPIMEIDRSAQKEVRAKFDIISSGDQSLAPAQA